MRDGCSIPWKETRALPVYSKIGMERKIDCDQFLQQKQNITRVLDVLISLDAQENISYT